ncbi:MAG TPA: septation protein A [Steroidobacteraceae bacterium]|nr:septation protein A [Steroidobacteraceae bacterium]
MQLLFDFFPVIAFFAAYKLADIYVATGVIIVAVLIQTAIQWVQHRKLNPMHITSAVLVIVFGGLTLAVHDDEFIKWKPTVLNWLFALAFLGSQFIGREPIVQRLLKGNLTLDRPIWARLNMMWVAFFVVMGAVNLYVAYSFAENTWVNFKLFGMLGLTLVFVLIQGFWLSSKMPPEQDG